MGLFKNLIHCLRLIDKGDNTFSASNGFAKLLTVALVDGVGTGHKVGGRPDDEDPAGVMGGGNAVYLSLYNGGPHGELLDAEVTVVKDGERLTLPAGGKVCLLPGQSVTITPYLYHDFHVEPTGGAVLLGEVSMCNDDVNDNCFLEKTGRFPEIEEDEAPYRLLCTEYPAAE